jgi:hypothetical protein
MFEGSGRMVEYDVGSGSFETTASGGTDGISGDGDRGDIEVFGDFRGECRDKRVVGENLPDPFGEGPKKRKSSDSRPGSLKRSPNCNKTANGVNSAKFFEVVKSDHTALTDSNDVHSVNPFFASNMLHGVTELFCQKADILNTKRTQASLVDTKSLFLQILAKGKQHRACTEKAVSQDYRRILSGIGHGNAPNGWKNAVALRKDTQSL